MNESGSKTPSVSLGKLRRLQQAATPEGTFAVLAIDHRGPLRRALAKVGGVTDVEVALVELKRDIVRTLADSSSAVLLDPETGVEPCVRGGALPGQTGLLVALDTGSTGDPARLETSLVPGWNPGRIAATGAAGVKLLVYYHPEAANAGAVEQLVADVSRDCGRHEIPLFLEPLSFDSASPGRPLASAERRRVVVETARRLTALGVDILKAEFPVAVKEVSGEAVWREACEELTEASAVPWVLLSAGVPFEVFVRQATVACQAGAGGVMAGRAVWDQAVTEGDREARRAWLNTVARERMERLRSVVGEHGTPAAMLRECMAPGA
ncbi:MAG: tagatose 1,6-diphosphate aldolase [Verrucomicrobiales bacterium]|nr:tagatose 1,6-diphosphate aldolase [Verrucomicrobiales bacterium]